MKLRVSGLALFNIDNNFNTNQASIQRTKSDGVPNTVFGQRKYSVI